MGVHKLAIIIPYRNRIKQLNSLLPKLDKFLNQKKISYHCFVIEQFNKKPFNKGALLNIGYKLVPNEFDYMMLHDVDYSPIRADYSFSRNQSHLYPISKFQPNYPGCNCKKGIRCSCGALFRINFFGGIVKTTRRNFIKANGFSNRYKGWGCEDNDFYLRCRYSRINTTRQRCLFECFPHDRKHRNFGNPYYPHNCKVLASMRKKTKGNLKDGLNQIGKTFKYKVVQVDKINATSTLYKIAF